MRCQAALWYTQKPCPNEAEPELFDPQGDGDPVCSECHQVLLETCEERCAIDYEAVALYRDDY